MEKIIFKRTFHPIGQGAFYTEIFSNNNKDIARIVYDCGTNSSEKVLEDEIDKTFDEGDEIDILFLSHLHADHVSGVEYLKKRCQIKTVVLPWLDDFEKVIVELDLTLHSIDTGIINPEQYFGNETSIVYIRKSDNEEPFNESQIALGELGAEREIRSGTTIKMNKISFWKYTPFNLTNCSEYDQFENLLIEKGIDKDRLSDIEYFKDKKKSLISCYAEINSDLNKSSLLVYSENEYSHRVEISYNKISSKRSYHECTEDQTGCLYTGDSNLTKKKQVDTIIDKLHNYQKTIGVFQVPHHGSRKNMSLESLKLVKSNDLQLCIVSAGAKRAKHPSKELLGELLYHGAFPIVVTEHEDTKVCQIIGFTSYV